MKPIQFKESNIVFAKDQLPYLPLPARKDEDGRVVSCWRASFKERLRLLFFGRVYVSMLTFNKPLQPIKMGAIYRD